MSYSLQICSISDFMVNPCCLGRGVLKRMIIYLTNTVKELFSIVQFLAFKFNFAIYIKWLFFVCLDMESPTCGPWQNYNWAMETAGECMCACILHLLEQQAHMHSVRANGAGHVCVCAWRPLEQTMPSSPAGPQSRKPWATLVWMTNEE